MSKYGSGAYGAGTYGQTEARRYSYDVMAGTSRGSYTMHPHIFKTDIYMNIIDEITPAQARNVVSSYNEDFETKRQATFTLDFPDAVKDLEDFVLIRLDVHHDNGFKEELSLGHFLITGRQSTMTNSTLSGALRGRDVTWLLQKATFAGSYVVPVGVDTGAAARDIILDQGFPANMINIPNSGVITTSEIVSKHGENVLPFLTQVLFAGAMYQPWVAMDHRITSTKMLDISSHSATMTYHSGNGAKVVPNVRNDPDLERLCNRVTVTKNVADGEYISVTIETNDHSSPIHPRRLGERLGVNYPVVIGKSYDESTIESVAEARAIAESRLSEGASFYDKVIIETYPDKYLDGHQIANLDLVWPRDGRSRYVGNWWQRRWEVNVNPSGIALVTRELTRTVNWR